MKRLLLPLLTALVLPTAVSALPFGNDLEIKNNVGEKTLIKGKTVSIKNLYKKDLINIIDKQIKYGKEMKSITEGEIDTWKKRYLDDPEDSFIKDTLSFYEDRLIRITPRLSSKSSLKSRIVEDKSFENIIHVTSVTFTPIYIDLNNKKEVGNEETIICFNSKLNNSYKRYWKNESSKSEKELIKKGLLMDKVCKKFAKFE